VSGSEIRCFVLAPSANIRIFEKKGGQISNFGFGQGPQKQFFFFFKRARARDFFLNLSPSRFFLL